MYMFISIRCIHDCNKNLSNPKYENYNLFEIKLKIHKEQLKW